MVAVAATATAARMRPTKRPRVRVFILACFLAYFFLGGAGTAGAFVFGKPGGFSFCLVFGFALFWGAPVRWARWSAEDPGFRFCLPVPNLPSVLGRLLV